MPRCSETFILGLGVMTVALMVVTDIEAELRIGVIRRYFTPLFINIPVLGPVRVFSIALEFSNTLLSR
jgi:hypothetical protein